MNDTRTWKTIEQMSESELKESAKQLDAALTELGRACESMDRDARLNHEYQRKRQANHAKAFCPHSQPHENH